MGIDIASYRIRIGTAGNLMFRIAARTVQKTEAKEAGVSWKFPAFETPSIFRTVRNFVKCVSALLLTSLAMMVVYGMLHASIAPQIEHSPDVGLCISSTAFVVFVTLLLLTAGVGNNLSTSKGHKTSTKFEDSGHDKSGRGNQPICKGKRIDFGLCISSLGSVVFIGLLLLIAGIESNPGPNPDVFPKEERVQNPNGWEQCAAQKSKDNQNTHTLQSKDITANENLAQRETVILDFEKPIQVHQKIHPSQIWDLPTESTTSGQQRSDCDTNTKCCSTESSDKLVTKGLEGKPSSSKTTERKPKVELHPENTSSMTDRKDVRPKVRSVNEKITTPQGVSKKKAKDGAQTVTSKIKNFFRPTKKSTKSPPRSVLTTKADDDLIKIAEEPCESDSQYDVHANSAANVGLKSGITNTDNDLTNEEPDAIVQETKPPENLDAGDPAVDLRKKKQKGALQISLTKANLTKSGIEYVLEELNRESVPVKKLNMSRSTWYDGNWSKSESSLDEFLLHRTLQKTEEIDLSYMGLVQVPEALGDLHQRLLVLNMAHNKLCTFDVILDCSILKKLVISFNMISAIPSNVASLVSLQELYIDENPIYEVPACLAQCKQLHLLKIGSRNTRVIAPEVLRALNDCRIEVAMKHTKVLCYPTYEQLKDSDLLFRFLSKHETNLRKTLARLPKYKDQVLNVHFGLSTSQEAIGGDTKIPDAATVDVLSSSSTNITGVVEPAKYIPIKPGNTAEINFTLTLESQVAELMNDLKLQLSCNHMKGDEAIPVINQTEWIYTDSSENRTCDRNDCFTNVSESVSSGGASITISLSEVQVRNATMSGNFVLKVNENVDIGTSTKCEVTASMTKNATNEFITTTISSNDIYFKPPSFTFDTYDDPHPVSEQRNLSLRLWMTPGNIKPHFFIMNPYLPSKEPKLSVTNMVMHSKGSNVVINSPGGKEYRDFHDKSIESWTRNDQGISIQDYSWTVSGGNDTMEDNTVSYAAQLRMEDWDGVENGSTMWTTMGCKIHEGLMWVGRHPITAEDSGIRTPVLTYSASLLDSRTIEAEKKMVIKGSFSIQHKSNSTAYAKNVVIKWFTLPYVSYHDTIEKTNIRQETNPPNHGGDQAVLEFTIPQVLFSDRPKWTFELSHPIDPVEDFSFLNPTMYTTLTELQYSVTINGTAQVFQGEVNFNEKPVQAVLSPEVCYCIPGDSGSGVCPCCEDDHVSCGIHAPGVCVHKDQDWLCTKVRPDHWKRTHLDVGKSFVCNQEITQDYTKMHSCFEQSGSWKRPWEGVDPSVGTVQGRDSFKNKLFATTNNGVGCVETDDKSVWFSRECGALDKLEGKWWYQKAEQLDVNPQKPYAIKGSATGTAESALYSNCNPISIDLEDPSCEANPPVWEFQTQENTTVDSNTTYTTDTWFSGTSSCKLQHVENVTAGIMRQNLTLPPNIQELVFTVQTKTENISNVTNGEFGIFIQRCNATGIVFGEEYMWITNTTSNWTQTEVYLYHTSPINYIKIGAVFTATEGIAYFDNFTLAGYEKPEPYVCMIA